jgi:hypothetical protein
MTKRAWLAAVAFLIGCGSSGTGTGGGDPAAAFAGNWTFSTGSIVPACTGVQIANVDLTGVPVMLTHTDTTHVSLVSTTGITCDVKFNVSGTTATAAAGQSCMIDAGATLGQVTVNITSWTLTLSGSTLTSNMNGTAAVSIVSCAPTSTGTLTKTSGATGDAGGQ